VKAVFDVKSGSGYDDDISQGRYQFPARSDYLEAANDAVGDWVLFREPQRNRGRRAYIGVARVVKVEPDPEDRDQYYAYVADFLEFATLVPLSANGRYAEASLREVADRRRVGRELQGRSVRLIEREDFDAIVMAGLSETLAPENAIRLGLDVSPTDVGPLPTQSGFAETADRRIEQLLVNRKIRDANFRLEVCRVYDDTCAVTRLKIVNGGGRAEVQAAHVKPVAAGGPDIVQNGIALSATVHWLFDRHLISIDEDYRLLVAHNRVPSELRALFRPEHERLHLPSDDRLWPHRMFLAHHREAFAEAGH
jgi:putative restriction endonuclease